MRDNRAPKNLMTGIMVVLVLLVGATGLVLSTKLDDNNAAKQVATADQPAAQDVQPANTVAYAGEDGKNALELLKTKAQVVTKDSAYGEYVDSINGVVGGTDGKYWAFYVNGQMAQVGADAYATKAGDKIEWKFE